MLFVNHIIPYYLTLNNEILSISIIKSLHVINMWDGKSNDFKIKGVLASKNIILKIKSAISWSMIKLMCD